MEKNDNDVNVRMSRAAHRRFRISAAKKGTDLKELFEEVSKTM